jgi:hypothetical protein
MGATFDRIPEDLQKFIEAQHMFFVATAPLSENGHVNLSPKGLETFRVLSPTKVGYLDLTGSGNETSAHVRENGRITFMFCAFSGPPLILRLYGQAKVILPETAPWKKIRERFGPPLPGTRQLVVADIHRVQTSCGYAVPQYKYVKDRDQLLRWAEKKGTARLEEYRAEVNLRSLDDLPTHLADEKARRD